MVIGIFFSPNLALLEYQLTWLLEGIVTVIDDNRSKFPYVIYSLKGKCREMNIFLEGPTNQNSTFMSADVFTIFGCLSVKESNLKFLLASMKPLAYC